MVNMTPLTATPSAIHFERRARTTAEKNRIAELAQKHFPEIQDDTPRQFRINTHKHFFQTEKLWEKISAFCALTGDSLPPLLSSLFMKKERPSKSWFLLSQLPTAKDIEGWMEIHPDIIHGGLKSGIRIERKTFRASDTEALTCITVKI
jgi:hypothetical protein